MRDGLATDAMKTKAAHVFSESHRRTKSNHNRPSIQIEKADQPEYSYSAGDRSLQRKGQHNPLAFGTLAHNKSLLA